MIVVGISSSIAGGSTSATTVNCTITGCLTDNSVPPVAQSYKVLDQRQLASSVSTLVSTSSSQEILISSIHLFNTGATIQTVTMAVGGTASANNIATIVLPANGWAIYEDGQGWQIYSSSGLMVTGGLVLANGLGTPSTATQLLTASTQAVITGTLATLATNALKVGSRFRFIFSTAKTGAGTATWKVDVKWGTAGTTVDGTIATITSGTNTAAIDKGTWVVEFWITALGSGTSATAAATAVGFNRLTDATGLGSLGPGTSATAGFDSTLTSPTIHLDATSGASAVQTIYGALVEQLN